MPPRKAKSTLCPTTGQVCVRELTVFERTITLRRWTGGTVKATVCSQECAQQWAVVNGKVIVGDSTSYDPETKRWETVIIIQHPDQVQGSARG